LEAKARSTNGNQIELVKKEEMQQQQQNEMNMQLIYSCFCLNLI